MPQQLDLAAAYLERHLLVATADYVAALRAVKVDSSVQQLGQVVLPEANLGLRKVGHWARVIMLHIAHLEPDFIPLSLVASLVGDPNQTRLGRVVAELQALSLVRVVHRDGEQVVGLQVHREIQACCK